MKRDEYKFYAFKLAGVCILTFIVQSISAGFTDAFLLNSSAIPEIWRFVTSIFLHGDLAHLAYNMFALILFGGVLEKLIGGKRFLAVFFITGILANIISVNFYASSLGASGAIFGVIGALILVRPGMMVWTFGMPMPLFIAGILWAAGDLVGVFNPSNIANIAHLAGMGFGLLFGGYFRSKGLGQEGNRRRHHDIVLNERYVRNWEDNNLR